MKPCAVRDVAVRPDGTVTFRGRPVLSVGDADGYRRNEDGTLVVVAGPCETVVGVEYVTMFVGPPGSVG